MKGAQTGAPYWPLMTVSNEDVAMGEYDVVDDDSIIVPDTTAVLNTADVSATVVYCAVTVQAVMGAVEVVDSEPVDIGNGLKLV
jgi:hypothetical protein